MFKFLTIILIINIRNCASLLNTNDDKCKDLLEDFSSSIADFTKCSIENARPISVCDSCVNTYISVLNIYENFTETKMNDTKMKCMDRYVNLDRLEVVESFKNNADDFWQKAKCDDCFAFENGTLTNQPSKVKLEFNWRRVNYTACLNWNQEKNDTDMCRNCMDTYVELNNYYASIGNLKEGIEGLCMDIVDWMNSTQQFWSQKCCKYRQHNEYAFIFLTTCMSCLPILFYCSARYFGIIRKTTIMSQTRFAESINAQSQSEMSVNEEQH